jgi:hypothetical protein
MKGSDKETATKRGAVHRTQRAQGVVVCLVLGFAVGACAAPQEP